MSETEAPEELANTNEVSPGGDDLEVKVRVRDLNFYYGDFQALHANSLDIYKNRVTAVIGPSGCGKSTHLRVYNRIFNLYREQRATGLVEIDGENVLDKGVDLLALRRKVGMIFQKPTPYPMSVYDNIAYCLKLHYKIKKSEADERVEKSLRAAGLWEEVKDKLKRPGTALSGGQQQRLCIARTIAIEPEVILLDEPTSAIDPGGTVKIEKLVRELKEHFTVIIVTHNLQQAARLADFTAFFYKGYIVEYDHTQKVFGEPAQEKTAEYVKGSFG
ncbi:MAG: phosphate ABC transporter ATP-binding protein PstB [Opitutales bacterium]